MSKVIIFLSVLLFSSVAFSDALDEKLEWNNVFLNESVKGVFVFCKGSSRSCITNNKSRAATEYLPASTFKIANSLIGLETGVIKNEFQVFKWDGKPRAMKQWEQDLTLRGAIQVSAVPVFQQVAKGIGEKRMKKYLNRFSYGNANVGEGIDKFWLEGNLRISALNQISFMESLYLNRLPISKGNQLIVKEALITEATSEYLVHSKTGYSGVGTELNPGVGWWVGWIEKGTEVYYFAFNMNVDDKSKLPYRKSIPIKLMASMGLVIKG